MIALPPLQGSTKLVAWRLDAERHKDSWDSGEGAFLGGGRWNPPGVRALYTSLDPATAILEVAVHKGFKTLDTEPHVLSSLTLEDTASIFVLQPGAVPNPNWLRPGDVSAGQMAFGANLLAKHDFILVPSVVSSYSWNLIFDPARVADHFTRRSQEAFALDPRLHPPASATPPSAPSPPPPAAATGAVATRRIKPPFIVIGRRAADYIKRRP